MNNEKIITRRQFLKSAAVFALSLAFPSEVFSTATSQKPRLEEVIKDAFHLTFPMPEEMNSTFIRFSAYSENEHFKGKIFSVEDLKKHYGGSYLFDRFSRRSGRNIPSAVLKPFYDGKFNPLSKHEQNLLNVFSHKKNDRFYITATSADGNPSIKKHELAHALFYINSEYRVEVNKVLGELDGSLREKVEKDMLNRFFYHPSVLDDELHARLAAQPSLFTPRTSEYELKNGKRIKFEIDFHEFSELEIASKKITELFNKYYKPLS